MSATSTNNGMSQESDQTCNDVSEAIISFGNFRVGDINYSSYTGPNSGTTVPPAAVCQHIQVMSGKRISTLDYLRKVHEGKVYWFNTLLFTRSDIAKFPSFEAKKLARRATNYLLLGISLSTIDNNTAALEYLKGLNSLLVDFESYQQIHPPDGPISSSLSRARLPAIFKRAPHGTGTKGRRTSGAADIGLPMGSSDPADLKAMAGSLATTGASTVSFAASEQELFPGEEYVHLLTPSLPFDPDFFETFATLCEVLIDCYTRIMSLTSSPALCAVAGVGEAFSKTDGRLRKVIIHGIVKEFEEACRSGIKNEMAGIGKVVTGGLV